MYYQKGEVEMASKREIKPVSFNTCDDLEERLLKHAAKNGAFSVYVKRLIQKDMERGVKVIPRAGKPLSMGSLNGVILGQ